MNENEERLARGADDVQELGIASVETQGGGFKAGEIMGEHIGIGLADA